MVHYVTECTRINELPVHNAQRRATHVPTYVHICTTGPNAHHTVVFSVIFPTPAISQISIPNGIDPSFLFISKSTSFCLTFVYTLLSFRKINTLLSQVPSIFSFWLVHYSNDGWVLWKRSNIASVFLDRSSWTMKLIVILIRFICYCYL